jgi:pSer/pThr/pTyr-binding forkhead associated (FHA) protein
MHAQLIPLDGERPITLGHDVTLVGRKPGMCDLIVDRSSVSKLHCLLVKTDGLLFVRDLGSTNGTKVNGQRVTRGALLPGDELAFASVKYTVYLGPDEEPSVGAHESTEMIGLVGGPQVESADIPEYNEQDSESDVRFLPEEY